MKKQIAILFFLLMICMVAVSVAYAQDYSNGFETDLTDWQANGSGAGITRVASGTNGVPSASGSFHAVVSREQVETTNWGGVFSRWGGYTLVFPPAGYTTQIDMYLDMSLADGSDKRLDFSSAISKTVDEHLRDFIFHVGTLPGSGATNQWVVSASNNAPGWPNNPGQNPITISQTGWYTFRHTFEDVGGVLSVTMEVLNSGGTVLGTWVRSDGSDIIGSPVGGNRYGWFTSQRFDFDWIAIDNASKTDVPFVPMCNGQTATITVEDGVIVGGPQNGQPYNGLLKGTNGSDVIIGTSGDDTVRARGGADIICTNEGDDLIQAGGGGDWIDAGPNADLVQAQGGNDTIDCGTDGSTGRFPSDMGHGGGGTDSAVNCAITKAVP